MKQINPIKDLRPVDPFNVPEGESSDEIESIRLTLISTRNKTHELVDIIKKKNLNFVKDTTTITDLDRRLRMTIARIPIMRGDANAVFGQDEDSNRRVGRFDFNRTTTTTTTTPQSTNVPTTNIQGRLIDFAIDTVLFFFGGRILGKLFKFGGAKLFNNKLTRESLEEIFKKSKGLGGKVPAEMLLEKAGSTPKTIKPNIFQKTFSRKVNPKRVSKSREEIKVENIRRTLLEAKGKEGLFDKKVKVNRESFFDRGKVKNAAAAEDYTKPMNFIGTQINKTIKAINKVVKTRPIVTRSTRIKGRKNLRGQDKVTYSDKKDLQQIIKLSKEANKKQVDIIKKYNMNRQKNINSKKKKFNNKDIRDFINKESNLSPDSPLKKLFNKSVKKSDNLDINSMSNDIAMLNKDTSVTRIVVIATGTA